MAIGVTGGNVQPVVGTTTIPSIKGAQLDPSKYSALGDFIDEVNAPDIRSALVKTYGDQGITGFLKMVGAVNNAGAADKVEWWEEGRLHMRQSITVGSVVANTAPTFDATPKSGSELILRKNDVVLWAGQHLLVVTAVTYTSGSESITFNSLGANIGTATAAQDYDLPIVGNMFGQGTDQQDRFLQSNVVKRENPYMISKEIYKVTGSQATNIGYIDLGGGDYRWYIKSEQDTRQRFLDKREMMLMLGETVANTSEVTDADYGGGSEGYLTAIANRGLVTSDVIGTTANSFDDIDAIIKELDKQGAPAEYAMYVNTDQSLAIDNMLAGGGGTGGGLANQYGAFNNSADTAVNLGFKSFSRGGYTFHKHDWKLLNDPTLLGNADVATNLVAGVMIPLTTVVDTKSGERAPALEMNYKATNGYSRELEHWMTGGGVLGVNTGTKDFAQFNYRSECNLVTRAANQHVLIKGVS